MSLSRPGGNPGEEIAEPDHALGRVAQHPECREVGPVAVADLLVDAEAALERGVLRPQRLAFHLSVVLSVSLSLSLCLDPLDDEWEAG